MITTQPRPTGTTPSPTPVPTPTQPAIPQEILDAVTKPLFTGSYTAVEQGGAWSGVPLLSKRVHAERPVAFTNEFKVLETGEPMVGYAAATFDDAVRKAANTAWQWSDPSLGGQIYSSVGVGILQAKDGAYYMALVGSGDTRTSTHALSYRSDRYDNNIYGNAKRASDLHATGPWSPAGPKFDDAGTVNRHDLGTATVQGFTPNTPLLKAVMDFRQVYAVGGDASATPTPTPA